MYGFPWGGSETLWSEAAYRALKRSHQVAAVTNERDEVPEQVSKLAAAGITTWVDPRPRFVQKGLIRRVSEKVVRRLWRPSEPTVILWKTILSWRPDLLCISQGDTFGFAFRTNTVRFLRENQLAYSIICQFNSETPSLKEEDRKIVHDFFDGARWVAFVADGNLRTAERELGAVIPNAILVKNPVNLTDLSPVPWPISRPIRFACVARLDGVKGQDLLFEALSTRRWVERQWRLRLYGAGPDLVYLKRLRDMYGLGDRIEFAGHQNDVRGIWADNHMLVLPSRAEGTPLSLVEAMVCGRPSVVTDVGGNAEWITEAETGFIAEAPSVRSIAMAMERAWDARESWFGIGTRAHEQAFPRIDVDAGGTLLELIERTVAGGIINHLQMRSNWRNARNDAGGVQLN
jgi:glycosyltransferase involved in cell wall biosynthesis